MKKTTASLAGLPLLSLAWLTLADSATDFPVVESDELVAERTVLTKTFDNGDGTETLHIGARPIHYRHSPSEAFQSIDTTLVAGDGWSNETNSFPVRLPPVLGDGQALELGQGLGIRWTPSFLAVHLRNTEIFHLGEPQVSEAHPSQEAPSAIVYPELFPGFDLLARVGAGALDLHLILNRYDLEFDPEEVEAFELRGRFEVADELLEAIHSLQAETGAELEKLPMFFGSPSAEFAIEVDGDPSLDPAPWPSDEPAEDETPMEGSELPPLSSSLLSSWRGTGELRTFFHYPTLDLVNAGTHGVRPSALTASFRFRTQQTIRQRTFRINPRGSLPCGDGGVVNFKKGDRFPTVGGSVGKGPSVWYRSVAGFSGVRSLDLQGKQIKSMFLGFNSRGRLPKDVPVFDTDYILGGGGLNRIVLSGRPPFSMETVDCGGVQTDSVSYEIPYNEWRLNPYTWTSRQIVAAGTHERVSTWSNTTVGFDKFVDAKWFTFGPMSNGTPQGNTVVNNAQRDLLAIIRSSSRTVPDQFTVLLYHAYQDTKCVPCTRYHTSAAVRGMNGELRVGAILEDLRLEVTTEEIPHEAQVTWTTVPADLQKLELFAGEKVRFDVELTAKQSFTSLSLHELTSGLGYTWGQYDVDTKFFQPPGAPQPTTSPALKNVGDKIRVEVTWNGPRQYGQQYDSPQKLYLDGRFDNKLESVDVLGVPVLFKGGDADVSVQPEPTGQSKLKAGDGWVTLDSAIELKSGSLKGGSRVDLLLETVKPSRVLGLTQGTFSNFLRDQTGARRAKISLHGGELAKLLGNGTHTLEIVPSVIPPNGDTFSKRNLDALKVQVEVEATSTTPVIRWVAPSSIEQPGPAPRTVSLTINGLDLGGPSSVVQVIEPGKVRKGATQSGSSDRQVLNTVLFDNTATCGAHRLELKRADGKLARVAFNVTNFKAGNASPFVVEAENGETRDPFRVLLSAGASGLPAGSTDGRVVGVPTARTPGGELRVRFRAENSGDFRIWVRYSLDGSQAPQQPANARTVVATREDGTAIPTVAWNPADTGSWTNFRYFRIRRPQVGGTEPPFTLTQGKIYELIFAPRAAANVMPRIDMIIVTDGPSPTDSKVLFGSC